MRDVGIVLKSNITIDRPANARGASRERNTVVAVFAQKQGFLPCFLKGDGWCLHQIIDKHTGSCLGVYSQANTGMIRYRSLRPNRRVFFIRQRLIRLLLRNFRLIKKINLNYYD